MSHAFTPWKTLIAQGGVNHATTDFRAMLVMSNTTADTEVDAQNPGDLTTLDEYNGSGYARATLTGEAVNEDLPNNRAEFTSNAWNFGSTVGAGTRQAVGLIVYKFVDGTAANDVLAYFIDSGGFPFNGAGGPIDVTPNAEGIAQIT